MLAPALAAVACLLLLAACSQAPSGAPAGRPAGADDPDAPRHPPGTDEAGGRPRTEERLAERLGMVARQVATRGVHDPLVLEALRSVPRHWFVPESRQSQAYDDRPLPIGEGQTISQPYIVALMTEALRLTPGERVLEIGTGSGYQAAVLAEITPHVRSIEIVPELYASAVATFERRGYDTIRCRLGDGYAGWSDAAPFDAIIVTAAPDHVPPALVEQLAVGGRMCLPVGRGAEQELVVLTRESDGSLSRRTLAPVRFVPMTGEAERR
jgi:protein-L-isoaspartate(D-aspartate) O-methyltransferase